MSDQASDPTSATEPQTIRTIRLTPKPSPRAMSNDERDVGRSGKETEGYRRGSKV